MRRPIDMTFIARDIRRGRHASYIASQVGVYRIKKNGEPAAQATTYVKAEEAEIECRRLEGLNPGNRYIAR